jgi:hypothetical protein
VGGRLDAFLDFQHADEMAHDFERT